MNKKEKEWFEKGDWRKGFKADPDESINIEKFCDHYQKYPEAWQKVFTFLEEEDLAEKETGTYQLDGENVFVIVQEYMTKNEDESNFEAHQKYIDLQYVVSGEEKIGVTELLESYPAIIPYDGAADIGFYTIPVDNYRPADEKVFFIFFPEDAHKPSIKLIDNQPVRKIVFKIRKDM